MKFNYNEDVSRILDYLVFPRIYGFMTVYKESEEESFAKAIDDYYLDFAERMHNKLADYEHIIKEFYQKDIYSHNDYYNILIKAFPVYDYKDEHQYLDDLLKMDQSTFKEKMIKALITMEEEKDESEEIQINESEAMKYINDLKIDSANKWNLLMMIQNPKEQLKKFIQLVKDSEHLFYDHYRNMKSKINDVGQKLADDFSKDTVNTFKNITYNSIDYDFDKSEVGYIYISSIFPYSLRISEDDPVRMVWGLEMEKSFKRVHDINEDQLTHRVKAFKALGDKTRYETLKLLSQGVTSIKKIADTLDVSSATISYHVNEFLTTGILKLNRGKEKKSSYKVNYDILSKIIEDFKEDLGFKK